MLMANEISGMVITMYSIKSKLLKLKTKVQGGKKHMNSSDDKRQYTGTKVFKREIKQDSC